MLAAPQGSDSVISSKLGFFFNPSPLQKCPFSPTIPKIGMGLQRSQTVNPTPLELDVLWDEFFQWAN